MAERKKDKRTNNDHQNITQKTKDRATRITLKAVVELWKVKQLLLHMLHPSCYSCDNPGDKSWMRKGSDYYDKWNISVAFNDTDIS